MNKINQNWIFGNNAGISFASGSPLNIPSPSMNPTWEGCASISDSNGALLFYTNGISVWRGDHTPVASITLNGNDSSTQSSIIVPDPGNSSRYYIFTADFIGGNQHVNAFLLDISTWTGTAINLYNNVNQTQNFTHTEKVTAIQHRNCKDYWIVTVVINNLTGAGIFRVWFVDSSGVNFPVDNTTINILNPNRGGYLKGSPNSEMLANTNGNHVVVYSFDSSNGLITGPGRATPVHLGAFWAYGVEFSPNNRYLYYGNGTTGTGLIFQVDLSLFTLTRTQVSSIPNVGGGYAIGALQLGMDKRIYFAKENENNLGAILNPNNLVCNVVNNNFTLIGTCRLGLPNLLPNPCDDDCNCGCNGCNDNAEVQNEELIERAQTKYNTVKSNNTCSDPFTENCENNALNSQVNLEPCFYFHWGDGINDQIEEHDTEVFYITVCNSFNDIQYNGLRITKINLIPNTHPIDKIQIVPDRFINLDCLEPCSCQTREFAMITRANDTAGNYVMEVEYCYDGITLASGSGKGKVEFDLEITED